VPVGQGDAHRGAARSLAVRHARLQVLRPGLAGALPDLVFLPFSAYAVVQTGEKP
jgi:hypothetical protein